MHTQLLLHQLKFFTKVLSPYTILVHASHKNEGALLPTMPQFHQFSDLPKELRDEIWDTAIRDDGPGVHFFSVYDT
jgi:hypothetical protein